ncbi:CotH kinase family protein [Anatilimnocola floriformis]|uniref:CotH kinase family protein n=1 Tax=Anatilimnocola floriformis TaxID=2948575 RepID=UPI0020C31A05|nr:CotH kinase family protein [Anatilimnocola floriformis]
MRDSIQRRTFLGIAATAAAIDWANLPQTALAQQNSPLPRKKSKSPDASDAFFINGEIPTMKIFIEDGELNKLRGNLRAYVKCRVVENDKTEYKDVGIKCKGAAGSFRSIDDRPAVTLNMGKYVKKQNFHAMIKFHLNNSVQDPSYLHEIICSDINLAGGVAAARATHARVWINNRDLGFYGLKEGFDKNFLKRHFADNDGNLYDGGFCQDIDGNMERDEGKGADDKADVKALVAACREGDAAKRWERVDALLDVDNFLSFMALELMCCHWDGYCNNRNNYKFYFDPTNKKAYFFPHGMDQMFGDTNTSVLNVPGAMVANAVMSNPEWRGRYRDRLNELLPIFNPPDKLHQRLDQIHARTRPVLAAINANAGNDHDNQMKGLKERLTNRAKSLVTQNATIEPRPLKFDSNGVGKVAIWAPQPATDAMLTEDTPTGVKCMVIGVGASGRCADSFRTKVLLQAGTYKLQGKARVTEVAAVTESSGTGAGLRLSGGQRTNKLEGTTGWTDLEHEFVVTQPTQEVALVAEMRATKGKVWFDVNSMQIVKVKK